MLKHYFKSEEAAVGTTEMVLLTLGIIALAAFFIYQVIGALQTSAEKSSCNGSNEVFCTE